MSENQGICQVEEIEALGAGLPVEYSSSVLDEKHGNYQPDAGVNSLFWAWYHTNWIQVSVTEAKLWNSVTIQGRGDSNK